jgi:hypothetical protein
MAKAKGQRLKSMGLLRLLRQMESMWSGRVTPHGGGWGRAIALTNI